MISAKQAKAETENIIKSNCHIKPKQKLLPKNEGKEFYIPLPYK